MSASRRDGYEQRSDSDEYVELPPRIIVVSNRLPVTLKEKENGDYEYRQSSGGLVTGLEGLRKCNKITVLWYGWAGIDVPKEKLDEVEEKLREDFQAIPLWMSSNLMELHYTGYSNRIIWPLFHYHSNDVEFDEEAWEAYRTVNAEFARQVAKDVKDGDIVWVHDYHLMLVPQYLRQELKDKKNVKVGFFLHTPWPSSAEFAKLPYREEVLHDLLHADLIGFHTYDYARHFLSSCAKVLRLPTTPNGVQFNNRTVHVGAFPIGIDPSKVTKSLNSDVVRQKVAKIEARKFEGKQVIIGVDRCDYIKGFPHKLHAFDLYLQQNPHKIGEVVLLQIAIPSREDVKEYQELRSTCMQLVGRINSQYGDMDYTPIVFRYTSVPWDELVSLYATADACLVTSTRDGMNLVAYEFIASQQGRHGPLVISEFAGAAQSMKGCILVNPWDINDVTEGIQKALELPPTLRKTNWNAMWKHVQEFTSEAWGMSFVQECMRIGKMRANAGEGRIRGRSE